MENELRFYLDLVKEAINKGELKPSYLITAITLPGGYMENELRFYLDLVKEAINKGEFKPSYLITAVTLPAGNIEIAINSSNIVNKIDYILDSYDNEMCLKTNTEIKMTNLMVV